MQYAVIRQTIVVSLGLYCFFFSVFNEAWALNLNRLNLNAHNIKIRKYLAFEELYSSNITLAPAGSEKSAYVTAITPGIFAMAQSGRHRMMFNYRMMGIYNAGGAGGLNVRNQLQFYSNYTVAPGRLYLNTRSTISQQNVSITRLGTDNFTGNNNTTISTFSFSPYWLPHFSQYARGIVRASYNRISSGSSQLAGTNNYSQNIALMNGRYFSKLRWMLDFNNSTNQNSTGETIGFQNAMALLRYTITNHISLWGRGGTANNRFQSTTGTNRNGFYYTVGARWQPSRRFSLSAGYGNNLYAMMYIAPFQRVRWITIYRYNKIGVITGNVWQSSLIYNSSRQSMWRFMYNMEATTTQLTLLELTQGGVFNPLGQTRYISSLPTLTNQVFIRKRGTLSYSFRTGKSRYMASVYQSRRIFQDTGQQDKVYGLSGFWMWSYSPRVSTVLSTALQQTDTHSSGVPLKDKFFDVTFMVRRRLARNIFANVEYRYLKQTSNESTLNYSENRVLFSLMGRF